MRVDNILPLLLCFQHARYHTHQKNTILTPLQKPVPLFSLLFPVFILTRYQKPKAKSQKPKAKSQKAKANNQQPTANTTTRINCCTSSPSPSRLKFVIRLKEFRCNFRFGSFNPAGPATFLQVRNSSRDNVSKSTDFFNFYFNLFDSIFEHSDHNSPASSERSDSTCALRTSRNSNNIHSGKNR